MKKSALLYVCIIVCWLALAAFAVDPMMRAISQAENHGGLVFVLVALSTAFIVYFWLNGVKDLVYTAYYFVLKHKFTLPEEGLCANSMAIRPTSVWWRCTAPTTILMRRA